ncbi:MAG TPA: glycosyltransferase family 4 protein [Candidatus Acidoferrales bacterium]|nr:glycosyltransferase family 4 protein [Candidatus Acidoferrales bacterium]
MPRNGPRIRVLYVQPGDTFGGTERQAATVMPLLGAHGVDVVPLVGPGETIVEWLRARGLGDVVFSADFPENMPSARGLAFLGVPVHYARARARIAHTVARLVQERSIDLVYASLPFAWASATATCRRLGVPIVWRAGGPQLYGGALGHIVFAPWARRHPPDLVVCSSSAVRATFASLVPAPLAVALNGVDLDEFQPAPSDASNGRPAGAELIVGSAARLVAAKGIGDVLAVAARTAVAAPQVRFVIAGDGPRRADYERRARALGAHRNVSFLGYVHDMRAFYAACDVLVLPSRAEGCPNVLLEAMATRRAVVAYDIAGIREVVGDGAAAVLVKLGDIEALHAAVVRLYQDPTAREALSDAGLARVRACFDARVAAGRIAGLLHTVVRGASAGTTAGATEALQAVERYELESAGSEQAENARQRGD